MCRNTLSGMMSGLINYMQYGKTKSQRRIAANKKRRAENLDAGIRAVAPMTSLNSFDEELFEVDYEMDTSHIDVERFILKLSYKESAILLLRSIHTPMREIGKILNMNHEAVTDNINSMQRKAKIMYN